MGINTPLGDTLDDFYNHLIAGQSAITKWKFLKNEQVYSKVGGDISDYDWKAKVASLKERTDADLHKRIRSLTKKAPFSTKILRADRG